MMFLRCFVFSLFFASIEMKQAVENKRIQSKLGKYLRNHVYKTILNAEHVQQCYSDCMEDNMKCGSLNFFPKNKTCELNDLTAEDVPVDYIDQVDSIYCANIVFGKQGYSLPRYNMPEKEFDVCKSNPCSGRGTCVRGENNTFHCTSCAQGFYGKMCEQKKDPCEPNPCRNSARCISTSTGSFRCNCSSFAEGVYCELEKEIRIVMDGSKTDVACFAGSNGFTGSFAFGFWFKTAQENAYFFTSTINNPYKFVAWKENMTFYFQFKPDRIISFTLLPTMYSSPNFWHHVFVTVFGRNVKFFFDSIVRHDTQIYDGGFNINGLEKICLGYHKEDDGTEHFFNGSIAQFHYYNYFEYIENTYRHIYCRCHPHSGQLSKNWISGEHLVQEDTCDDKLPFNNVTAYLFQGSTDVTEWMEYNISKTHNYTEFALTFWILGWIFPTDSDYVIACFSHDSVSCDFTVEILKTMQLRVVLGSHVYDFPLLPIFDMRGHFFVISWNNSQGELLFLLDMAVQGQVFGVLTNSTLPEIKRFKMGGNGMAGKTFEGWILEMNFWDPVPSVSYLEKMYEYPGPDIGNVVAFTNFVPALPEHEIEKEHHWQLRTYDYMTPAEGFFLDFKTNETNAFKYYGSHESTGYIRGFSVSLWFYLKQFPALLFSNEQKSLALTITDNGEVLWKLGSDVYNIGTLSKLEEYNFLAISWDHNGNLSVNFKGNVSHVSSNFSVGHMIPRNNRWYLGSDDSILFGKISNLILWNFPLPVECLKALAHGLVGIASADKEITWSSFVHAITETGPVYVDHDYIMTEATYSLQLIYDAHCSTALPHCSEKAYARIGVNVHGVFKWGCFCYDELDQNGMVKFDSIGNYSALDSIIY